MSGETAGAGETPMPRGGLRGWLGKVRTRRWARLFLFEFLVVLLGVLSAQALAAWLGDRAERARAERVKLALDTQLHTQALEIAQRVRSSACFHHRLDLLRRDLSAEREPSVQIYPPFGRNFSGIAWEGDTPALILEHYGSETATRYEVANRLLQRNARSVEREAQAWTGFSRLTNQFGSPTPQDFAAAKEDWLIAERMNHLVESTSLALADVFTALEIVPETDGLSAARESDDICVQALSFPLAEHAAAKERRELVTGEDTSYQFLWKPKPRPAGE